MRCSFCGHDPLQGRFCDACGMAVPSFARPQHLDDADTQVGQPEPARCRQCGVYTTAVRCPGCGIPVSRDD